MRATCPHCNDVLEAEDLKSIVGHVSACKKRVRKSGKQGGVRSSVPPIDLSTLPLQFVLNKPLDSQNKYHKVHWTRYAKSKTEWKQLIAHELRSLSGQMFEWSRWELTRFYVKPKRAYDTANLVGGAKPIPDALIDAGIIVDDRPKNFECAYGQIESDTPLTVLRLLEARYG